MAIEFELEASSPEEAKEKAFEHQFNVDISDDDKDQATIVEFEMHDWIVQGNVFSGVLNEVRVRRASMPPCTPTPPIDT